MVSNLLTKIRRHSAAVGVIAAVGCLVSLGARTANADPGYNSFSVLGAVDQFLFNVDGTPVDSTSVHNLNSLLSTGSNSTNTLNVGWTPPPEGSYIELQYNGSGGTFSGTTLATGDILRVYSIGGAFLTNGSATAMTSTFGGYTITNWDTTTSTTGWSTSSVSSNPGSYVGYTTSYGSKDPFLSYDPGVTVDTKTMSQAEDGLFDFNGLTFDSTVATLLGLDIYAQVWNPANTSEVAVANTGRVIIDGYGSDSPTTPEGSSLAMMALGLIPIFGGALLSRRRAKTA